MQNSAMTVPVRTPVTVAVTLAAPARIVPEVVLDRRRRGLDRLVETLHVQLERSRRQPFDRLVEPFGRLGRQFREARDDRAPRDEHETEDHGDQADHTDRRGQGAREPQMDLERLDERGEQHREQEGDRDRDQGASLLPSQIAAATPSPTTSRRHVPRGSALDHRRDGVSSPELGPRLAVGGSCRSTTAASTVAPPSVTSSVVPLPFALT